MEHKGKFFFLPALVLCIVFVLSRLNAQQDDIEKKPEYQQLEKILAFLIVQRLEKIHFSRPNIDDEVSARWFDDYFSFLDPRKVYFYQRDLDNFNDYRKNLDDLLKNRNLSFAQSVHKLFIKRVREKFDLVKKILDQEMDFSTEEKYLYDRDDASWIKDEKEAYEVWRKTIKNSLLAKELLIEDGNIKKKKHSSLKKKTPRQSVLKTRENHLKLIEGRDEYDVLEIYVSSLTRLFDPHSNYWSYRTAEDFEINITLSLQGIGATLTIEDGYTKVTSLIQGGPAQKQGELKIGNYIIEVTQEDGETVSVVNMPLKKVVRYIRGKKGTKVQLGVETQGGVQKQIVIVRDEVKLEDSAATGEIKEIDSIKGKQRVGYIYLPSFYSDWRGKKAGDADYRSCTRDVQNLIKKFEESGKIDALVLDLRGNGGGDLEEAIKLSGLFIQQGPIVQIKYANGFSKVRYDNDPFHYDFPLLTLVDHSSASASEIFAGAMQDYGRGIIIGDYQTHGKGTVQSVIRLNDNYRALKNYKLGSIKFTIAKFYRVTGASTQKRGIVPDIILPSFADHFELGEKDLDNALVWDEIVPAKFKKVNKPFKSSLQYLKKNLQERLNSNFNYKKRLKKIKEYGKIVDEKYVSLNKKKRREEQKKNEEWGTLVNKVLFGHIPRIDDSEEKTEKDSGDVTDYKLQEAYHIIKDFLSFDKEQIGKIE